MNYWESKFRKGEVLWGFEPSDSAVSALRIFEGYGLKKILIPGFGYGRNARLFLDSGFDVTGIEISESAVRTARENNIDCSVHTGSVTAMPFDNEVYDAVFCYALIHLLNKRERKRFLSSCFQQLREKGRMIFVVASTEMDLYGKGKMLAKDRFGIETGLRVFFYDTGSIVAEFSSYGLIEYKKVNEPVKFMEGVDPLKMWFIVCQKG